MLTVSFEGKLKAAEITAFRSAIIEKAGRENNIFHNHQGESQFIYRYPVVQYKVINQHPTIQCIDSAVDEIHHFFENKDWTLNINGNDFPVLINRLNMFQFTLQVWDSMFQYRIRNWVALNTKNYPIYKALDSLTERTTMLESLLKANILSMAKGIDWTIDKEIKVSITEMEPPRLVRLKDQQVMAFNVLFKTNVSLPDYIGLGKSVSIGYGMVARFSDNKSQTFDNVD